MVQVIFRNVFEDTTISINIKKFCNVPLSKEERGLAYQILGCYVTKPFLENCIIQQEILLEGETYYERRKQKQETIRSGQKYPACKQKHRGILQKCEKRTVREELYSFWRQRAMQFYRQVV